MDIDWDMDYENIRTRSSPSNTSFIEFGDKPIPIEQVTQLLDETVDVVACFGHLGHEVNSALLPISPDDELIVKSMILSGLPFKEIVTQLRITRWNVEAPAEMQPRLCHLTVRDVSNIASRHGLLASFKDDVDVDGSPPTSFLVEEEDLEEDEETNTEYYEESDEDVIVD
ncbi:hypothetical protein Y032_0082g1613 [Ancylostoma ceylanicum]|uniref:Uncharacterized protein n=3 Tax=Ancylostoma ceylanicum TaxID=53326 RepID=A0A016TS74_9BILA|nr:hypothetical protein Y032_0082g1613 [Ancylostoma ceylanicum]